jgi:L-alanine-DL-glutamate epimerase-like enolase superfamily enzyme
VRIESIEATMLRDPVSGEETTLVIVAADDGTVGYGEALAHQVAVKAVIEARRSELDLWDADVQSLLLGEDPRDPKRLWRKLKSATFWSCRTGLGHVALAGVDMALWDLAGKIQGMPVWQLLGEQKNFELVPYVTVYHGDAPFSQTLLRSEEVLRAAKADGFRAAKVEALSGNAPGLLDAVELTARAREILGPDVPLLLDVGYRWSSFAEAEECARAVDEFDLFALEAPFPPHQLDDYRQLAAAISTPVATGDILTAASEYFPLLDAGVVSYVQGGAARTGISDMLALAEAARARGRQLVPWGWAFTTLTAAANVHVAVVTENIPLIEYWAPWLYDEMDFRTDLSGPEPSIVAGRFELPTAPGLGVTVAEAAVDRYRVE